MSRAIRLVVIDPRELMELAEAVILELGPPFPGHRIRPRGVYICLNKWGSLCCPWTMASVKAHSWLPICYMKRPGDKWDKQVQVTAKGCDPYFQLLDDIYDELIETFAQVGITVTR